MGNTSLTASAPATAGMSPPVGGWSRIVDPLRGNLGIVVDLLLLVVLGALMAVAAVWATYAALPADPGDFDPHLFYSGTLV